MTCNNTYILYAVKGTDVISSFLLHSKHWLYYFCIWCELLNVCVKVNGVLNHNISIFGFLHCSGHM